MFIQQQRNHQHHQQQQRQTEKRRCGRRKVLRGQKLFTSVVLLAVLSLFLSVAIASFPFTTAFVVLPTTTTTTNAATAVAFEGARAQSSDPHHQYRWRRNAAVIVPLHHHHLHQYSSSTMTPITTVSNVLGSSSSRSSNVSLLLATVSSSSSQSINIPTPSEKETFLQSLDRQDRLNEANHDRTNLLNQMIEHKTPTDLQSLLASSSSPSSIATTAINNPTIQNPGRWESMQPLATGTWTVVYAPHMSTMAKVEGGGEFRVTYILNEDGTMQSHARLDFPWMGWFGSGIDCVYLSVSGTYGSVDDTVCRVDFNKAWIKTIPKSTTTTTNNINLNDDGPYPFLSDVPDSLTKNIITSLGNLFFVDSVSVFPVSFLDQNMIVFDFELLGTRICAMKG